MQNLIAGLATAVALTLTAAAPASAAFITGSLNMYGDFQPMIGASSTQDLSLANNIDFLPASGGSGAFTTGVATADLSGFANASGGVIQDLTFAPFSSVGNFYALTVGGATLTFDLASLSIATQNSTFLTMAGTGVLHLTGFEDTIGTWNFSGQSSAGASSIATFSWSAGSAALPVPEPASLALVGLGLLAAGAARRRKEG